MQGPSVMCYISISHVGFYRPRSRSSGGQVSASDMSPFQMIYTHPKEGDPPIDESTVPGLRHAINLWNKGLREVYKRGGKDRTSINTNFQRSLALYNYDILIGGG